MSNKRRNRKHKKKATPTGTDNTANATPKLYSGKQNKYDHYSERNKFNQSVMRRFRA